MLSATARKEVTWFWTEGNKQIMSNLEIDNYCEKEVDLLKRQLAESRTETHFWKSSHDNQVELKRQLMDRPDLKDRAASLQKLHARIAQLEVEMDELLGK